MNSASRRLRLLLRIWAVIYMILVAALAWISQRGPRIQAQPVQFRVLSGRAF